MSLVTPMPLAPSGRSSTTGTPSNPANLPAPISTGDLFLSTLQNTRLNLGPLIYATGRHVGDMDLFEVNAGNAQLLHDLLIFKILASDGVSTLTTYAAPKVAVPNNIGTFKGRTFEYNVVPATNVPKRGTVRMMTKTAKEWQANLTQKGIGSHIEGGAYRTPQGAQFLRQELQAMAMAMELNQAIQTAITLVNSGFARPFFMAKTSFVSITPVTFAHQIKRELDNFCSACRSPGTFATKLSEILITIPNANTLYLSPSTAQNLVFNSVGPGEILPTQSIAMVQDQSAPNGQRIINVSTSGGIRSLYSILGGNKLQVLPMPTFGFSNGKDRFQPLEHAATFGEFFVLGSEMNMKGWHELDETSYSADSYSKECLVSMIYDQGDDIRKDVSFFAGLKHAHIFADINLGTVHKAGHLTADRDKLYAHELLKYLTHFNDNYFKPGNQGSALAAKQMAVIVQHVQQSPMAVLEDQKRATLLHQDHDYFEIVSGFKRFVQYPLTTFLVPHPDGVSPPHLFVSPVDKNMKLCLPDKIGDLDPMHLGNKLFKCMHADVKRYLQAQGLVTCKEHADFMELKNLLTKVKFDPTYWELVYRLNLPSLLSGKGNKSLLTASGSHTKLNGATPNTIANSIHDWPLLDGQDIMIIPTYEDYTHFARDNGKATAVQMSEYIPQGLWFVGGLRYLANNAVMTKPSRLPHLAESALGYLKCLWNALSKVFPHSTLTMAGQAEDLVHFGNYGSITSKNEGSSVSENEGMQIIMNLLDDEQQNLVTFLAPDNVPDGMVFSTRVQGDATKKVAIAGGNLVSDPSFLMSKDVNFRISLSDSSQTINLLLNYESGASTRSILLQFKVDQPTSMDWVFASIFAVLSGKKKQNSSYASLVKNIQSHIVNTSIFSANAVDARWPFDGNLSSYLDHRDYVLGITNSPPSAPNGAKALLPGTSSVATTNQDINNMCWIISMFLEIVGEDMKSPVATTATTTSLRADVTWVRTIFSGNHDKNAMAAMSNDWNNVQPATKPVMNLTIAEATSSHTRRASNHYLLTPFVIYGDNLPTYKGEAPFMMITDRSLKNYSNTMITKATNLNSLIRKKMRITSLFADLVSTTETGQNGWSRKTKHTAWFEKRYEMFVELQTPHNVNSWNGLDRLVAAFILFTQHSMPSIECLIYNNIRPPFEVVLWRPFMKGIYEGALLMEAGLRTAFNPYANAHIGMSRDGTTDQYQVRAVLETDTVVINPQNIAFLPFIKPKAYLGGRGTRFIIDSKSAMDYENSVAKMPSLIGTVVSHGYMALTEDPISFINKPTGKISMGFVEESTKNQLWPGWDYYGFHIYKTLFKAAMRADPTDIGTDNVAYQNMAKWLREQSEFNHVCFRGNQLLWDPNVRNWNRGSPGTGHFASDEMNDTGARAVFDDQSPYFINQKRPSHSNTY